VHSHQSDKIDLIPLDEIGKTAMKKSMTKSTTKKATKEISEEKSVVVMTIDQ
jgi:hypothetical protein